MLPELPRSGWAAKGMRKHIDDQMEGLVHMGRAAQACIHVTHAKDPRQTHSFDNSMSLSHNRNPTGKNQYEAVCE